MDHPLLDVASIEQSPEVYLHAVGNIFARFDPQTQDSGNLSYGVRIGEARYFVKTAGRPNDPRPYLSHPQRVALLRNAVRLHRACDHLTLPRLHQVIESPQGPMLVYAWAAGDLVGTDRTRRADPHSSFQRFRRLPTTEILRALDDIYHLHHELAQAGWIAVDFYDGCLLYDFERQKLHVVDLDNYQQGPFTNEMGRMFGSSRFMAPEEYQRGAAIDERTNIFTMGRTALVLLSDGTLAPSAFHGSQACYQVIRRACRDDRRQRYPSMEAFYAAWRDARRL